MKVLTLNTWQKRGPWKPRWELIFEGLKKIKPDLVFFQEIFDPEWIAEITKRSRFSSVVYHDAASGLALFSTYPCLASGSRMLEGQSEREDYRRYLLFGQFQTKAGCFFAFNTHLSWRLEDGAVRSAQTGEIARVVTEVAQSGESLIAGDFNAAAWTPEICLLTQQHDFVDLFKLLNPERAGLTWTYDNVYTRESRHPLPDRRIDFIFSKQAGTVLGRPQTVQVVFDTADSGGTRASDHYGVLAEFSEDETGRS